MSGQSASDTRAATALEKAVTVYRRYLETGIRRHRSVGNIGNIDCIEFVGEDAVAQLQNLRKHLRDALESSYHARTLAPSADVLATKIPSLWQVDRELNSGVLHVAESRSEKLVPFAEFVRADVLDVLGKALARLMCAFPAIGTAHSRQRPNKSNSRKRAKRTVRDTPTAKQMEAYALHLKGLSNAEIGKRHGISKEAARKRVNNAKGILDRKSRSVQPKQALPVDCRGQETVSNSS